MPDKRFPSTISTLILFLGGFLAAMNLLQLFQDIGSSGTGFSAVSQLALGAATAALAVVLAVSLIVLYRSPARARSGQLDSQTQAERARAKEEWVQTFDAMSEFVSVHTGDFRIVKANRALCRFFGKTPEEIIGRFCYQLFHNQDHPIEGCPHATAKQIGHSVTMEVRNPDQGAPLLVTCFPFVDQQGAFAGSVHIAKVQASPPNSETFPPPRFIPICASCKDIRDEHENWVKIEDYLRQRLNGQMTHSICKECQKKIYPEFFRD